MLRLYAECCTSEANGQVELGLNEYDLSIRISVRSSVFGVPND